MAQTITKERLKQKIDQVQDEYLDMLYQIIQVFEASSHRLPDNETADATSWLQFVEETYGSFQDDLIERGL
ncbi:MAG: hypothetical protein H6662_13945 [Ardenticatenaceae bacterium]|nr:hypothetical protein [Anaerolineales bacterium]MCB8922684.1 hypothetical protein [Ardenticatenaceae bacterium]MCB8991769.1 hypothetical protein [Ardenticatenaceae bacterium]MCB9003608.1 hypothetical protein [Ardenticatenaceae bacterium]